MTARGSNRLLGGALTTVGVLCTISAVVLLCLIFVGFALERGQGGLMEFLEKLSVVGLAALGSLLTGLLFMAAGALIRVFSGIADSLERLAPRPEPKSVEATGQASPGTGADRPA